MIRGRRNRGERRQIFRSRIRRRNFEWRTERQDCKEGVEARGVVWYVEFALGFAMDGGLLRTLWHSFVNIIPSLRYTGLWTPVHYAFEFQPARSANLYSGGSRFLIPFPH